jgi:hypothetical protein
MNWATIEAGTVAVRIFSDLALEEVVITTFLSDVERAEHNNAQGSVAVSKSGQKQVDLSKADFGKLDLDKAKFVQIQIVWPEAFGVAWGKFDASSGTIELEMRTPSVCCSSVVLAGTPGQPEPLLLDATYPGKTIEYVLLAGDGGSDGHDYPGQAISYLLISEFSSEATLESRPIPSDSVTALWPEEHVQATVIHAQDAAKKWPTPQDRVTWTRLWPADRNHYASTANLKRKWFHWYPIGRVVRSKDSIASSGGLGRLYDYLNWVGEHHPGRVREVLVISHATLIGPSFLFTEQGKASQAFAQHGNGPGNGDIAARSHLFAALCPGAQWIVTGCTKATLSPARSPAVTSGSVGAEPLVLPRLIDELEAHIRTAERLRRTLRELQTAASAAAPCVGDVSQLIDAVVGKPADDLYRWQRPGLDETEFRVLYRAEDHSGERILKLSGIKDGLKRLGALLTGTGSLTPDQVAAAASIAGELLEAVRWEAVCGIEFAGELDKATYKRTLLEWIRHARLALSAQTNFAAGLCWFAKKDGGLGLEDVFFASGVPGWGSLHLEATVRVLDEAAAAHSLPGTYVFSTHFKGLAHYGAFAWNLTFLARFGQTPLWPYCFLPYTTGQLDADGTWLGVQGYGDGFNYESLDLAEGLLPHLKP